MFVFSFTLKISSSFLSDVDQQVVCATVVSTLLFCLFITDVVGNRPNILCCYCKMCHCSRDVAASSAATEMIIFHDFH